MQSSGFVSDTELNGYINNSYFELYDLIVSRYEDYYSTLVEMTISTGNSYTLPTDFYKLRGVDYDLNGNWIELRKWNFQDRNKFTQPNNILNYSQYRLYRVVGNEILLLPEDQANGNYRVWYVPRATAMADGVLATATLQALTYTSTDIYVSGDTISISYVGGGTAGLEVVDVIGEAITVTIEDGVSTAQDILQAVEAATALVIVTLISANIAQTTEPQTYLSGGSARVNMDPINGWDEYIVIDSAIKCLQKEESDVSVLLSQKNAIIQRIEALANNRDAGEPERTTDITQAYYWNGWAE